MVTVITKKKRIDPAEIKKIEAREQRKRHQCEAFAGAIEALHLPNGSVIVDFGSGSCGLTLPLAFFLPHLQFVAVDLKEKVNYPLSIFHFVWIQFSCPMRIDHLSFFFFFLLYHIMMRNCFQKALTLMRARAEEAGVTNVRTVRSSILAFDEIFDLALALHACGQASDDAILKAVDKGVPYLVSPCCLGKVKFSCTDKSDPNRQRGVMAFIAR
jgi:hypothetical protein